MTVAVFAAAIGSGLVAGIFFAFSTFVMAGLARLPASQGVAAMNHINVTVINPAFMTAFMGMTGLSLALGIGALFWWSEPGAKLVFAASLLYFFGCFGVTMVFNVPLNNRLASVSVAESAALWARYLKVWTMWNHVRTIAPMLASALFVAAQVLRDAA